MIYPLTAAYANMDKKYGTIDPGIKLGVLILIDKIRRRI